MLLMLLKTVLVTAMRLRVRSYDVVLQTKQKFFSTYSWLPQSDNVYNHVAPHNKSALQAWKIMSPHVWVYTCISFNIKSVHRSKYMEIASCWNNAGLLNVPYSPAVASIVPGNHTFKDGSTSAIWDQAQRIQSSDIYEWRCKRLTNATEAFVIIVKL